MKPAHLRRIPAVDKLLQAFATVNLPRPLVVDVVRQELAKLRLAKTLPPSEAIMARIETELAKISASRLQRLINGTGILIHTNFGRAPLPNPVVESIKEAAAGYINLEYDLIEGKRAGRASYLERILALLCQGEAATVVNNCAAALVLIVRCCISGPRREVIVSRGELVQIGGGFRIPEILEASGAQLREVGTTNKTSLEDYARAISKTSALVLKVHQSNFFMDGFVESATTQELAALTRKKKIPLVEDLGSGALIRTETFPPLAHEPTPAEILNSGVDAVCFSGDKLLGGPQAGIIAGRAKMIAALKREPFFRALRCDKLVLAGLQATAEMYLKESQGPRLAKGTSSTNRQGVSAPVESQIPVISMISWPQPALQARAEKIVAGLTGLPVQCQAGSGRAQLGGGTLPRSTIPSVTIDIRPLEISLELLARRLRGGAPPIVGYISGGRFKVDLRTVFTEQDAQLLQGLIAALSQVKPLD